MPNTKPLVAVATACEKVLVEKDGVASLIRIVDTFAIPQLPPDAPPNIQMQFSALIVLKSGDLIGTYELRLQVRTPTGQTKPIGEKWPIMLNGGEHGANIRLEFPIPIAQLGLYWIDVLWYGEILTSFPIKLVTTLPPATPDKS